jgi:preprotein translocase subunit SecA
LSFDSKTHRRSYQLTTRLRYVYLAAQLLGERNPERITQDVLVHLEEAQEKMSLLWGLTEWNRLDHAVLKVTNLDPAIQKRVADMLGPERAEGLSTTVLAELGAEDQEAVILAIGQRIQSEIYRQLLLSVISELWVDYLTKVEALRVSIGLEAYAQRDPLVQYKNKASQMFSELLSDIRAGVISRMFIFRPVQADKAQVERSSERGPEASKAELPSAPGAEDARPAAVKSAGGQLAGGGLPGSGKKKRRRH